MNLKQRRKFVRWFCLLAPSVAALFTVGFFLLLINGKLPDLTSYVPIRLPPFILVSPVAGWIALTLGCAIKGRFDFFKARGDTGWVLAINVAAGIPFIAFAHACFAAVILYAGVVVAFSKF